MFLMVAERDVLASVPACDGPVQTPFHKWLSNPCSKGAWLLGSFLQGPSRRGHAYRGN